MNASRFFSSDHALKIYESGLAIAQPIARRNVRGASGKNRAGDCLAALSALLGTARRSGSREVDG